jgi:hypothetical protein
MKLHEKPSWLLHEVALALKGYEAAKEAAKVTQTTDNTKKELLHGDYCTLLMIPEDQDILTRPVFDVNMRLYESSFAYRQIIQSICDYIRWCAVTEKEGYKPPHGWSGANAGIPFNIIATHDGKVMINPKILHRFGNKVVKSNCGSLLLPEPIPVNRANHIQISYLDRGNKLQFAEGMLATVQHEVDHNQGILITDRRADV